MKGTNTGNVRMVNLSCRKCGMSLDCDASHMQAFCPNCGGRLFITVSQVMDILDEKKIIRQKSVKYMTDVSLRKMEEPKKRFDILPVILIVFLVIGFSLFIWKSGL